MSHSKKSGLSSYAVCAPGERIVAHHGVLVLLCWLCVAGCASSLRLEEPGSHPADPSVEVGHGEAVALLWRLPADTLRTQSSFQLKYGGPEGGATPKLILRLVDETRFKVQGSELGKRIFTLEVDQDRALFSDHRNKTFCWMENEINLSVLPLGSLPLRSLPLLLFDRLPIEPKSPLAKGSEALSFFDSTGRSWSVRTSENGEIESWTVSSDGQPQAWLLHDGRDAVLSAPDLQLRWRIGRLETLAIELDTLRAPERYVEDCSGHDE